MAKINEARKNMLKYSQDLIDNLKDWEEIKDWKMILGTTEQLIINTRKYKLMLENKIFNIKEK